MIQKKLIYLILLFSVQVLTFSTYSLRGSSVSSSSGGYSLGLGLINHNAGIAATDATTATKPFWYESYYQVNASARFSTGTSWIFSPNIYYSYPSLKTPEGHESTSVWGYNLRGIYPTSFGLDLHTGLGVLYYQIKGSGGTVQLNNGAGTSTFGTPSATSTSNVLCLDFGFIYKFDNIHFDTTVLVSNFTTSSKLAISPLLSISMELF